MPSQSFGITPFNRNDDVHGIETGAIGTKGNPLTVRQKCESLSTAAVAVILWV